MKLFRGDLSSIIVYNLLLLFCVISTGEPELLYLLLVNVFLIIIQVYIIYRKNKKLFENRDIVQKNNDYNGFLLNEEEISIIANDLFYEKLPDKYKKEWLLKQYIWYCVLMRKKLLVSDNGNDFEDLRAFILNCPKEIKEDKIKYLLKIEKNINENNLRFLRKNYYKKTLKKVRREFNRDNVFEKNYDFFFKLEDETDNEMKKYIETGIFGIFSHDFQLKINSLFHTDIDLNECFYMIIGYIYNELFDELYEKNNLKKYR